MGRFLSGKKVGSRIIPGVTKVLTFTTITYPAPNKSTVNQNVWLYDEYLASMENTFQCLISAWFLCICTVTKTKKKEEKWLDFLGKTEYKNWPQKSKLYQGLGVSVYKHA